jgi:hypothetical protein
MLEEKTAIKPFTAQTKSELYILMPIFLNPLYEFLKDMNKCYTF